MHTGSIPCLLAMASSTVRSLMSTPSTQYARYKAWLSATRSAPEVPTKSRIAETVRRGCDAGKCIGTPW